jgi:hypothetical protein
MLTPSSSPARAATADTALRTPVGGEEGEEWEAEGCEPIEEIEEGCELVQSPGRAHVIAAKLERSGSMSPQRTGQQQATADKWGAMGAKAVRKQATAERWGRMAGGLQQTGPGATEVAEVEAEEGAGVRQVEEPTAVAEQREVAAFLGVFAAQLRRSGVSVTVRTVLIDALAQVRRGPAYPPPPHRVPLIVAHRAAGLQPAGGFALRAPGDAAAGRRSPRGPRGALRAAGAPPAYSIRSLIVVWRAVW